MELTSIQPDNSLWEHLCVENYEDEHEYFLRKTELVELGFTSYLGIARHDSQIIEELFAYTMENLKGKNMDMVLIMHQKQLQIFARERTAMNSEEFAFMKEVSQDIEMERLSTSEALNKLLVSLFQLE